MLTVNPKIVFRDESALGGILFNSETGAATGINPLGKLVWQQLAEGADLDTICTKIRAEFADVPDTLEADVKEFITNLLQANFLQECGFRINSP